MNFEVKHHIIYIYIYKSNSGVSNYTFLDLIGDKSIEISILFLSRQNLT